MNVIDCILGRDFDGRPASPSDVLSAGIDDTRRESRVPDLRSILHDSGADPSSRFIACIALTNWAVEDGFRGVIEACSDPEGVDWRGESIDRMYSVDNTFAQLAMAIGSSRWIPDVAVGFEALRQDAVRALVGVADLVYFDGQLESIVMEDVRPDIVEAVSDVVQRGIARVKNGDEPRWDLPTQLVDVTAGVAVKASRRAVDLAVDLVAVSSSPRLLRHAVDIVARAEPSDTADLADLLCALGGDTVTPLVVAALEQRRRLP